MMGSEILVPEVTKHSTTGLHFLGSRVFEALP